MYVFSVSSIPRAERAIIDTAFRVPGRALLGAAPGTGSLVNLELSFWIRECVLRKYIIIYILIYWYIIIVRHKIGCSYGNNSTDSTLNVSLTIVYKWNKLYLNMEKKTLLKVLRKILCQKKLRSGLLAFICYALTNKIAFAIPSNAR